MRRALLPAFALMTMAVGSSCEQPELDPNIGAAIGRCTYVNAFNSRFECREYLGSDWTFEAIEEDCSVPVPGSDPGLFEAGLACDRDEVLGQCQVDPGTVEAYTIVFPDGPDYDCSGLAVGCSFAGGQYEPAEACGGEDPIPPNNTPFEPFQQVCVDPLPGEPPGQGPDGQVCTWEAISAATEVGRHYTDYASCEPVLTQRPYIPSEVETRTPVDDPRYTDEQWQSEFAWVNSQIESSACVCCHTDAAAPAGPTMWWLEQEGIWVDALTGPGLAMMAGWVDSTAFGAFHPDDNNGFSREVSGTPSTDEDRMVAFFEGELERRGLTPDDFADTPPFGGPLADQLVYEPDACRDGAGIDAEGVMEWIGGRARYVYVLEEDTSNPGAPPNLDLPAGTIWRLDVAPTDDPITDGFRYGEVPAGSTQFWPQQGAPAELESGRTYYLYVLADVYQPLTRCLFTAP